MDNIKVEVDFKNESDSCFLCLQSFTPNRNEQLGLNFLFNYLKVEKVKSFVCEKCGEILRQFVNAWKSLEKARLQMDYYLDCIQSTLLNSNGSEIVSQANCVWESVIKRCKEKIWNPKAQILLERIDLSKLIKKGTETISNLDYSDNWSPNWNDESKSSWAGSECELKSPASLVTNLVKINLEKTVASGDGKRVTSRMPAKCEKCSKTFRKKAYLKRHNDQVHLGIKPYKCSTCTKSFTSTSNLTYHINAIHLKPKPKPQTLPPGLTFCEICKKTFVSHLYLKCHMRDVHPPAKFPCEFCNKMFKRRDSVKKHISSAHLKQRLHCHVIDCKNTFYSRTKLVSHYKLKHPDLALQSKRKEINVKENYSEKVENGEKVFECKLCAKVFKREATVVKHITYNAHEPNKLFMCEICGYKINHTGHLQQHMARWHNTQDPVECKFCKKKVNTPLLLKIHIKNAHSEKKLQCQYCGYVTARKQHLQIHLKNVHKKTEVH